MKAKKYPRRGLFAQKSAIFYIKNAKKGNKVRKNTFSVVEFFEKMCYTV